MTMMTISKELWALIICYKRKTKEEALKKAAVADTCMSKGTREIDEASKRVVDFEHYDVLAAKEIFVSLIESDSSIVEHITAKHTEK